MCQKPALDNVVGEVRGVCCLISSGCCKCLAPGCSAPWINVNSKGGGIWKCEIIGRKAHPQVLSAVQEGLCLPDICISDIKDKVIDIN